MRKAVILQYLILSFFQFCFYFRYYMASDKPDIHTEVPKLALFSIWPLVLQGLALAVLYEITEEYKDEASLSTDNRPKPIFVIAILMVFIYEIFIFFLGPHVASLKCILGTNWDRGFPLRRPTLKTFTDSKKTVEEVEVVLPEKIIGPKKYGLKLDKIDGVMVLMGVSPGVVGPQLHEHIGKRIFKVQVTMKEHNDEDAKKSEWCMFSQNEDSEDFTLWHFLQYWENSISSNIQKMTFFFQEQGEYEELLKYVKSKTNANELCIVYERPGGPNPKSSTINPVFNGDSYGDLVEEVPSEFEDANADKDPKYLLEFDNGGYVPTYRPTEPTDMLKKSKILFEQDITINQGTYIDVNWFTSKTEDDKWSVRQDLETIQHINDCLKINLPYETDDQKSYEDGSRYKTMITNKNFTPQVLQNAMKKGQFVLKVLVLDHADTVFFTPQHVPAVYEPVYFQSFLDFEQHVKDEIAQPPSGVAVIYMKKPSGNLKTWLKAGTYIDESWFDSDIRKLVITEANQNNTNIVLAFGRPTLGQKYEIYLNEENFLDRQHPDGKSLLTRDYIFQSGLQKDTVISLRTLVVTNANVDAINNAFGLTLHPGRYEIVNDNPNDVGFFPKMSHNFARSGPRDCLEDYLDEKGVLTKGVEVTLATDRDIMAQSDIKCYMSLPNTDVNDPNYSISGTCDGAGSIEFKPAFYLHNNVDVERLRKYVIEKKNWILNAVGENVANKVILRHKTDESIYLEVKVDNKTKEFIFLNDKRAKVQLHDFPDQNYYYEMFVGADRNVAGTKITHITPSHGAYDIHSIKYFYRKGRAEIYDIHSWGDAKTFASKENVKYLYYTTYSNLPETRRYYQITAWFLYLLDFAVGILTALFGLSFLANSR